MQRRRLLYGTGLKEPILFNETIQLSSEAKYLGIILDKGLTWKKQLDTAINKAYKAFWTCRGTFGKTWGLRPKDIHYGGETHYDLCCHQIVTKN
jgi:hypothetical protein